MGLFGKDKKVVDVSNYDTDDEGQDTNSASAEYTISDSQREVEQMKTSNEYGIQDAIELMRQLPDVNTDIVIGVVIKTLESANIQVDEIIEDAQTRETRIESRSVELIKNIEQLEEQIAGLTEEITHLNTDFEETSKVKNLLVASLRKEKSSTNDSKIEAVTTAANEVVSDDAKGKKSKDKNKDNETANKKDENMSFGVAPAQ